MGSSQLSQKYSKFNPQLNLITLKINYKPSYYTYYEDIKEKWFYESRKRKDN